MHALEKTKPPSGGRTEHRTHYELGVNPGLKQTNDIRLGTVAGPVIQAIGRPNFEDGLRMGTTVEVITDSHSVCNNPEASLRLWAR